MYRIGTIKLKISEDKAVIPSRIAKKLGKSLRGAKITKWNIVKESLDARDKGDIRWVYTVDFETEPHVKLDLPEGGEKPYQLPESGDKLLENRPVVCGFGPAGMFAALILAEAGYRPLVIERGKCVSERASDVEKFWNEGKLDIESNVQFGEGGAGTFSDGKLTTGIKDVRISKVLREFVCAGADDVILYKNKPHIGTDVLRTVVKSIREKIISLGGEVMFSARLDSVVTDDRGLKAIKVSQGNGEGNARKELLINTSVLVLAIGHSARDTVRMLYKQGIDMTQKPFSIGMRIEHPQSIIDKAQYGACHEKIGLPPAEYKLSHRTSSGRGVYTFCMCPGGCVITASSQENSVVTNGMSYNARDKEYANSALLVDVRTDDFGSDYVLAGIEFQEKYEKLAFENGGSNYKAPKGTLKEFLEADKSENGRALKNSIPEFATEAIVEALPHLGKKLKGFDMPDAVFTATETRSSSPVRFGRDEGFESNIKGIYPSGEGAGYAGGIMSAAVDGIKIAEAIIKKYRY